jgi:hypothetical protein
MKKHTGIALAAVLAAGLGASLGASIYLGPYWTLYRMKAAVEAKDADALSRRVDYPALRQSMKSQLTAAMNRQLDVVGEQMKAAGAPSENVGRWRQVIPMGMVGVLVERLVTPDGVAAMLSGAARFGKGAAPDEQPPQQDEAGRKPRDLSLDYRGWNEAVFRVKDSPGEGFVFRRDGLWGWKLSGVEIGAGSP